MPRQRKYFIATDNFMRDIFGAHYVAVGLKLTFARLINLQFPKINYSEILKTLKIIFSENELRSTYARYGGAIQYPPNNIEHPDFDLICKPPVKDINLIISEEQPPRLVLVMKRFTKVMCPTGRFSDVVSNLCVDDKSITRLFHGIYFQLFPNSNNNPSSTNNIFELLCLSGNIATMKAGTNVYQYTSEALKIIPSQSIDFADLPFFLQEKLYVNHVQSFRKIANEFGLDVTAPTHNVKKTNF